VIRRAPRPCPAGPRAGKPEEVEAQRRRDETLWATSRGGVRTALCVEERGGDLFVILPPLRTTAEWIGLVEIIDGVRRDLGTDVVLEGYPPPRGLSHMAVTPDPGVLEVNLPPTSSLAEYEELLSPTGAACFTYAPAAVGRDRVTLA
jgi:uncharacterized protein (DUF2126 family)